MRGLRTIALFSTIFAASTFAQPQAASNTSAPKTSVSEAKALPRPPSRSQVNPPTDSASAKLPVRRVVLYKAGVGYFEHVGQVTGDQAVPIDFTTSQLNDVLQSLTVLDLGGGRIVGVNYNSEAPLS
jgi:hypothetical protein